MKNGFDLIFGIFRIFDHFDKKVDSYRKAGKAGKILTIIGFLFLGLVVVGFWAATTACFKQVNFSKDGLKSGVFVFFGAICFLLALYTIFYVIVEIVSSIIIALRLTKLQKAYAAKQQEMGLGPQEAAETRAQESLVVDGEQITSSEEQDRYKEFEALRPAVKTKRKSFLERMKESRNLPYSKTSAGFDYTMVAIMGLELLLTLVFTCVMFAVI